MTTLFPSHKRFPDMAGRKFGRFTVIAPLGVDRHGYDHWLAICDCGTVRNVKGGCMRNGGSKSCGCLRREASRATGKANFKHGKSFSPEYGVWSGMVTRCTNANDKSYVGYGDRGIKICARWLQSFEAFYRDVGPRPSPKHSIERRDNDGDYEPGNCYWATILEQSNNRRDNRRIAYCGRVLTIAQWARALEVSRSTAIRLIGA